MSEETPGDVQEQPQINDYRARAMELLAQIPAEEEPPASEPETTAPAAAPDKPAEPAAEPEPDDPKTKAALSRLARQEARLRQRADAREAELKTREEAVAKREAADQTRAQDADDVLADAVAFMQARGIPESEYQKIAEQLWFHLLADKAPPEQRAMLEAKAARREAEKLRKEREADRAEMQKREAESRKAEEARAVDTRFREHIDLYSKAVPDKFPLTKLYVAQNGQAAAQAMRTLGYQLAQANPEAERISMDQIAEVLEKQLAHFAAIFQPASTPPKAQAETRAKPTTLSQRQTSERAVTPRNGWDPDAARRRAIQILEDAERTE